MNYVEPLCDIEKITWTNLKADAYCGSHRDPVALFLNDVINPSLDTIEARIDVAQREEGLAAEFELIDLEPLHSSTLQGYTLTLQSVWERQLRGYVIATAIATATSDTANWHGAAERGDELLGVAGIRQHRRRRLS